MPSWNADQYLRFAEERTRPCSDLVSAISVRNVRHVIDLGCGPGNSTTVLAHRWPDAEVIGLDNSTAMIQTARAEQPNRTWIVRDIASWAEEEKEHFDVVFSNAALQWVENHPRLFPNLLERVSPGGVLAIQIPADFNAVPHRLMRELAPSNAQIKEWHSHHPAFYYDVLSPRAASVNVWETIYQHVLPNADAIVEWYKGTGMRPFLEACKTDSEREEFLAEYTKRIRVAFPSQPDGKVLFPFRRLFAIASK
jgi:trans-aconitate 2-methyltransferase